MSNEEKKPQHISRIPVSDQEDPKKSKLIDEIIADLESQEKRLD